jgi:hypothetical protein
MDLYAHVRIMVGVVLSLGLAQLLRGVARLIQHPKKERLNWVHLSWVLFTFLYVVHFWCWEFWLRQLTDWNIAIYLFTIAYAVLIYLMCSILFPDSLADYDGYEDYFYSRRGWFFGLLIAVFALDLEDTLLKGRQYYLHLGIEYPIRAAVFIVVCAIAIFTRGPVFVSMRAAQLPRAQRATPRERWRRMFPFPTTSQHRALPAD